MNGRGGFTLIELIMVILVLGILAAVAAPRFIGADFELGGAAEKLIGDLSYCQELNMIRNGEDWRLYFAADRYFIWRDDNHNGVKDAAEPYAVNPVGRVDYRVALREMHLDGWQRQPEVAFLGFTAAGRPFYPGSSGDFHGLDFILQKDGRRRTVHLESVTGYAY